MSDDEGDDDPERLAQAFLEQEMALARERDAQQSRTHAERVAVLKRALEGLSEARLQSVRELLPSEENGAQQIVVWVYACILETGSAGLTILFDRFTQAEVAGLAQALETIGASETAAALRGLLAGFEQLTAAGKTPLEASEALDAGAGEVRRRQDRHLAEMERCLLRFCEEHLEELAAI